MDILTTFGDFAASFSNYKWARRVIIYTNKSRGKVL